MEANLGKCLLEMRQSFLSFQNQNFDFLGRLKLIQKRTVLHGEL
jgi:hypothetical protein